MMRNPDPSGALTALPRLVAGFKGLTSKESGGAGKEEKGREWRERWNGPGGGR